MFSFEPLMPSLLEKLGFTPLGGGGAPSPKIVMAGGGGDVLV